jgi:transcriptional regulator with XRE-family HTH domain
LNGLIRQRWGGEGKVPGNALIARLIRDETGLSISTGYLWMLRTGQRDNPTGARLQALARFFGKPPAFFLDAEATSEDFELAAALRQSDIRQIALRSDGLSVRSKQAILALIEKAREAEELDADEAESVEGSKGASDALLPMPDRCCEE